MNNEYKNIFIESEERNFGIVQRDGNIFFSVPKLLMPSKNEKAKDYIKMISSYSNLLLKYERSKNVNIKKKSELKNILDLSVFNGLANIMKDYDENPDFIIYKNKFSKKNKKINWSKTIQSSEIFISKNLIVHNSFMSKEKTKDFSNDVYILYEYALSLALSIFKKNKIGKSKKLKYSKNQIKNILLNFEDLCFKDREINIIKNLKLIFINGSLNLNKENNQIEILYHERFEFIWEHMVNNSIPSKYKVKKTPLPKGKYYFVNSKKTSVRGMNFRIDHIAKKKNRILIMDSKFYNFYDSGSPPLTESISKQENYLKLLSHQYKDFSLHNFFIFPKNNIDNKEPEYFAYHSVDEEFIGEIHDFKIKCIALDIKKVINLYLLNKSYTSFFNCCYETSFIQN